MSKAVEQNKILKRALWLASARIHTASVSCPNPETCCDVNYLAESFIRQAESTLDVSYGVPTYEEDLAEMRAKVTT